MSLRKLLVLALLMTGATPVFGATAQDEIGAMIRALGASQCRFQRNGSWHTAAQARAHLQRKYEWGRKRGMVATPEEFIERAASRSSLSGKPYRVACRGKPEQDAGAWFGKVLRDLRKTRKP